MHTVAPITIFVTAMVCYLQWGQQYIWRYGIRDSKICFLIIGVLPWMVVPMRNIVEIRRCTAWEALGVGTGIRSLNKIVGNFCVIHLKAGLIRRVYFTPDDPDEYIEAFKAWSERLP